MGRIRDILKKDIPGTRHKPRRDGQGHRFDLAAVLMVLAGPVGLIYYLSIHRRLRLRRAQHILAQIRIVIQNNAPLADGLMHLALDAPSGYREVLSGIANELDQGESLADALASYPSIIPREYVARIRLAEETGQLVRAFDEIIRTMGQDKERRAELTGQYYYILSMLIAQAGIISFIWVKVIPVFAEVVQELYESSTNADATSTLIPFRLMSILTPEILVGVFPGIAMSVTLIALLNRFWYGQQLVLPILYRVPVVGKLMRLQQQRRIIHSLELLVRAGVPLPEALGRILSLPITPPFHHAIKRVKLRLEQGEDMSTAWKSARNVFSSEFIAAMALGEYSDSLADACLYAGQSTERAVMKRNRILADSLIPAYAIVGGAINLWIILIVHTFIISMAEFVG